MRNYIPVKELEARDEDYLIRVFRQIIEYRGG